MQEPLSGSTAPRQGSRWAPLSPKGRRGNLQEAVSRGEGVWAWSRFPGAAAASPEPCALPMAPLLLVLLPLPTLQGSVGR